MASPRNGCLYDLKERDSVRWVEQLSLAKRVPRRLSSEVNVSVQCSHLYRPSTFLRESDATLVCVLVTLARIGAEEPAVGAGAKDPE